MVNGKVNEIIINSMVKNETDKNHLSLTINN